MSTFDGEKRTSRCGTTGMAHHRRWTPAPASYLPVWKAVLSSRAEEPPERTARLPPSPPCWAGAHPHPRSGAPPRESAADLLRGLLGFLPLAPLLLASTFASAGLRFGCDGLGNATARPGHRTAPHTRGGSPAPGELSIGEAKQQVTGHNLRQVRTGVSAAAAQELRAEDPTEDESRPPIRRGRGGRRGGGVAAGRRCGRAG